ncbi:MAG: glycosyltransferase family 2 protein [Chloroflexota bacterium]
MSEMKTPLVSFVIPAYCEESNIENTLAQLNVQLEQVEGAFEFVVVDDGSDDGTWDVLEKLSTSMPNLNALRFSRNFGKEAALYAGLEASRGDAVIVIDADLQHPVEIIPEMIQIWQQTQAGVVDAKRQQRGSEPFWRRIGAWVFYAMLRALSGYDLMGMSDYKLLDREVVDAFLAMKERNRFFRGMIPWLGFKHVEISFVTSERSGGDSKWSLRKLVSLMVTAITSFSSKPLQLITLLGSLFFIFSLLLVSLVLYQISTNQAVEGFATVIILQLIIGSIIMLGLGLVGTYLAKIYEEVKQRPFFVTKETLKKK